MRTLDQLKPGESGIIKEFAHKEFALKLIEMGCLPGEKIKITKIAPLGDPIAIEVSGYELSMRKQEAANVLLEE
jgi:ferrous iron transport protein A